MVVMIELVVPVYVSTVNWFLSSITTFLKLPDGLVDTGFLTPCTIHEKIPVGCWKSSSATWIVLPLAVHETCLRLVAVSGTIQVGLFDFGGLMSSGNV